MIAFVNHKQDNWDILLLFCEFSINNSVQASVGTNAYRLKLHHILHCHPVFNVTALKLYEQNQIPNRKQATSPPVTDLDGHTRYTVEGILNRRKIRNRIQYLVKWQGYHDATWEPEIHLKDESGNDIIALQHYKASKEINVSQFYRERGVVEQSHLFSLSLHTFSSHVPLTPLVRCLSRFLSFTLRLRHS